MITQFEGLKIGTMVKNLKTSKNWIVTDFISSYSSVKKSEPDVFEVRISNGIGKSQKISIDSLKKNYEWINV
jgi:hypothetical protein